MSQPNLEQLLAAGVHFGHQTRRWNPKMRPYLYGARNGTHIIDLDQTVQLFRRAFEFVSDTVARGLHECMQCPRLGRIVRDAEDRARQKPVEKPRQRISNESGVLV